MTRYGKRIDKRAPAFISTRRLKTVLAQYEEAIEEEIKNSERLHGELADAEGKNARLICLHSGTAKFNKDDVAVFSKDTAHYLVELAEEALEAGGKVSFAAACAVSLKRRLDAAPRTPFFENCTFTNNGKTIAYSSPKPLD